MATKTAQIKRHATLVEKAKKDKESGAGVGRGNKMESTRAAFRAWLLKPRIFLGKGEHVLNLLGITDVETVELYSIRSQGEFSEKFGVGEPTLSHWKREMQNGNDFKDFQIEMRGLTKNVMGALYRQAMAEGDAPRVKLWLQTVEGWNESNNFNVAMGTEPGLTDEEKADLLRMLEKNTHYVA
ncbi:MAG: hypothetical protein WA058_04085 [Minisyncoccia bacterium]